MPASKRPSFLKRQKEQQRAARAQEKREAKRAKKAAKQAGLVEPDDLEPLDQETDADAGDEAGDGADREGPGP